MTHLVTIAADRTVAVWWRSATSAARWRDWST